MERILYGRVVRTRLRIGLLSATCLALSVPAKGFAQCVTSGSAVTCSGTVGSTSGPSTNRTALVGTGASSTITSVTIADGATASYERTVISTGSGTMDARNTIVVNGVVQSGGKQDGPNRTGGNGIEFGSNTDLIVNKNAVVEMISTGDQNAEAINPTGSGNVITNYGTIKTDNTSAAAIWMEGTTSGSVKNNGVNRVDNYGLIQAQASGTGSVVGNSNSGTVYFTNFKGATVRGNINLGTNGLLKNVVTFENGSIVDGTVSGGGNSATLNLTGAESSDALSKSVSGFGTLNKSGTGTWVVGAQDAPLSNLSDTLNVNVGRAPDGSLTDGGTLVLAGDVSSTHAVVGIDNGTLQLGTGGTSGWIDGITHNNGTLAFNRSDTNTLSSKIDGTGAVAQIGSGKTILTGTDSYTGKTTISNGTLQLGNGTTTGSIANTSGIVLSNNSNFIVNNPTQTTVTQVVQGAGNFEQAGSGSTILTNTNTYTGTTTISGGSLQLGDGTNSGSIANSSAIIDNSNLTINNPTATALTQVISGTGSLTQQGSGTTTLSNANSYTGATTVAGGLLSLVGNGDIAASSGVHASAGQFNISGLPDATTQTTIQALDGAGSVELGSKTLVLSNANDVFGNDYSGTMSGTGNLTIAGGQQMLSGSNSYTGTTTVAQGAGLTLTGSVASALTNNGVSTVEGGSVGGLTTNSGSLTAEGASLQDINNSAGTAYFSNTTAGALTNASGATASATDGTFTTANNAGILTLGAGNTVSGDVTSTDGQLTLDGNVVAGTVAANNGTLSVSEAGSQAGSLSGAAGGALEGTLTLTNANSTFSGALSGIGGLTVNGGQETLSGINTYTGETLVAENAALGLTGSVGGALTNNGTSTIDGGTVGGLTTNRGSLTANGATLQDVNNSAGTARFTNTAAGALTNASGATASATGGTFTTANNEGTLTLGTGNTVSGDVTNTNGQLTLDGNSVAGTVAANGGAFSVTEAGSQAGSLSGGAAGALAGSLTLTNAKDTYSGTLSGSGGLSVANGTEVLTGGNTYTGITAIGSTGTLQLGNGGTAGTISNTQQIINDGTLSLNHADDVALSAPISGAGTLVQAGTGTTTLGNVNSYAGGSTISAGTLVGSASSFGSGAITDNAALIIHQDTNAIFDNGINGTGTFTKTGSGALTLDGMNALSGPTTLSQGELAVNGSLAASAVTAQSGTVLSGTGTVGGIVAESGSTIRPAGNAVGTLSVTGNYQQNAGATYAVQVTPGSNTSDLVAIKGTATLADGAQLSVSKSQPGNYTLDTKYRVLTAQGGVSGVYNLSGATAVSAFYALGTTYDANNVYLEVMQEHPFTDEGDTRNQKETAGGLDGLPNDNPVKNAVGNLPDGEHARQAFDALSGEIHASARTSLLQDSFYIRDAAVERMRGADCGVGADSGTIKVRNLHDARKRRGSEGACEGAGPALWMQAYGSWGHNQGNGNAASMNHSTGGFVMGFDTLVRNTNWHVGALVGYGFSGFNVSGRRSSGHSNNLTAGVYGGTHWGRLGLRMGATYTWNMLSTNRTALFSGYSDKLNSRYDGGTAQAFADLGYRFDVGRTAVEPFANVAYANLHTDRYREHGGAAALRGTAMDTGITYSTFGVRVASPFKSGTTIFIPNLTAAYRHAFGEVIPTTNQRFVAGGNDFSVAGVPLAENSALVNVGVKAKVSDTVTLGLSYVGQYGDGYLDSGLRGTFSWVF